MTDYICLWKSMLNEGKLETKYKDRCGHCDGHDLLCWCYQPDDECSALEGFDLRNTSSDLMQKILRGER